MEDGLVIDFTAGELATTRAAHAQAVARLRQALLDLEPGIPPEAIAGASVEELEASFAAAKALLPRSVPAGAPGRLGSAAQTPRAKIRAGLQRLA
ncbi:MAG: hypothetical protein ACKVVT_06380 [Dehalococcoidia bacterium]